MMNIEKIGASSAGRISILDDIVARARHADFPEVDKLFNSAMEKLHAGEIRISVVGQVKAGKSSLINAITGLNDFLPTEVNPWTAVITDMHFGHPDKEESGGVFELFSDAEWNRMVEGDPESRKLAEELLPGFKSEILKVQIEEMRQNAQKRLGGLYHHLLGKKHKFNTITPEILERYVSAGYGDGLKPSSDAGKFSGITKSASVFLPLGTFAVPATLSDTPGINDPFLVRDEITTSSFRNSDIFIVTLSIHQALNTADIALLKMLSIHSGKKTIIFVNRIDELEDPAKVVPEVISSLDERLQGELDNPNYLLIAGSAEWGRLVTNGSDEDLAAAEKSEAFASYWSDLGIDDEADLRAKLFAVSGLKALGAALSDFIEQGPAKDHLAEAVGEVSSATSLLRRILEDRISREDVALVDSGDFEAVAIEEKARIEDRVRRLAGLAGGLKGVSAHARERLMGNGDVLFKSVVNTIEASVGAFVEAQTKSLREGFADTGDGSNWKLDTGDIRSRVESQVQESYQIGRGQLDKLLMEHAKMINDLIAPVVGDVQIDKLMENLPHDEIMPSFKPNSTLVEVELVTDRGMKFWKNSSLSEDEAVNSIKRVIRAEMFPAVENLQLIAREAIAERTGAALERLSGIMMAARQMLEAEVIVLKSEIVALNRGADSDTITRINGERKKRTEERRERVAELTEVDKLIKKNFSDLETPPPSPVDVAQTATGG